jgi:glycosyltransferase involved in cell wall biosynthesis
VGEFVLDVSKTLVKLWDENVIEDYEIIVLDDGSSDETKLILERLELVKTKTIFNERPSGIHSAFLRLYREAQMSWVLLVPGDAQWPPREIEKLIRFHFGSTHLLPTLTIRRNKFGYSRLRTVMSNAFSMFASIFLHCSERTDPGSIKIIPNSISNYNFICNSVLIEIERIMMCEYLYGNFRQFDVDTVARFYGTSSTLRAKTLIPVIRDCAKLLISYKLSHMNHIIKEETK